MNRKRIPSGSNRNDEDKIVLESCPNGGIHCQFILKRVNELIAHANDCFVNKDYQSTLEYKSEAFKVTVDLKHEQCLPCVDLFRDVIQDSVRNSIYELEKLTTGLFRKKNINQHYYRQNLY